MFDVRLTGAHAPRRILALGCHADDIEIGRGATLLRMIRELQELEITWSCLRRRRARGGSAGQRRRLPRRRRSDVVVHDFRDGFFPSTSEAQ